MRSNQKSAEILARNRRFIPGGMVSLNRATQPELVFVRGEGAHLWDADGHRYIDYHAAFAPYILGHNDPDVNRAVGEALRDGSSLFGSGTTVREGELAELIATHVPGAEQVQLLNTGSEATYQAIRAARAVTGRDHLIVMQGAGTMTSAATWPRRWPSWGRVGAAMSTLTCPSAPECPKRIRTWCIP